jgi:hypothetical protein
MPRESIERSARWVVLALLLPACGGGRIFSGPEVAVSGLTVKPEQARLELGELDLRLELHNESARHLSFEPHRTVLVGPDGSTYREKGGERSHRVRAGGRRRVRLTFPSLDWKLEHAPGFYVRLEGFSLDDVPVELPALPLGHPVTNPDGQVWVRRIVASES